MMFYTGVGSRETPHEVCGVFTEVAMTLNHHGFTLRSGGARGADISFQIGVLDNKMEIYLPEDGFNKNKANNVTIFDAFFFENYDEALYIAKNTHPNWSNCDSFARKAHIRNVYQVLGRDLKTPSDFLICWTKDAVTQIDKITRDTGGTSTAIKLALLNNVPVFNVACDDSVDSFVQFMMKDYGVIL